MHMLYASTEQSDLNVVKITLSSISSENRVPAKLRDRFVKIILDAMHLQEDPSDIPRAMDKESIDLAIQMLQNEKVKNSLSSIHDKKDVEELTPHKAIEVLEAMGYSPAH